VRFAEIRLHCQSVTCSKRSLSSDGRSHESASAKAGSREAETAGAPAGLPSPPPVASRQRWMAALNRSGGQLASTCASSAGRASPSSAKKDASMDVSTAPTDASRGWRTLRPSPPVSPPLGPSPPVSAPLSPSPPVSGPFAPSPPVSIVDEMHLIGGEVGSRDR